MKLIEKAQHYIEDRVEKLVLQREEAYTEGNTGIITMEIATFELLAGGVHFLKLLTNNNRERQ